MSLIDQSIKRSKCLSQNEPIVLKRDFISASIRSATLDTSVQNDQVEFSSASNISTETDAVPHETDFADTSKTNSYCGFCNQRFKSEYNLKRHCLSMKHRKAAMKATK